VPRFPTLVTILFLLVGPAMSAELFRYQDFSNLAKIAFTMETD
jgi:hypothetical protein